MEGFWVGSDVGERGEEGNHNNGGKLSGGTEEKGLSDKRKDVEGNTGGERTEGGRWWVLREVEENNEVRGGGKDFWMSFADIVFWCTGLHLGVEGYLPGYRYARGWRMEHGSMEHGFCLGLGSGSFFQGRPPTHYLTSR
jgi:hypothetical protein